MGRVSQRYRENVISGAISADPAQQALLPKLDALLEALERPVKRGFFGRTQASAVKGLYIWGGVGGGKSYLMDLFANSLAVAVRRVHFHAFMQEVQGALHLARQTNAKDALLPVCQAIAKDIRVLALDEMQIKDIADAMIVGRLFELLLNQGVTVITTSNRVPEDLYKNGLNRQLFLPFIALIRERFAIHDMASEIDFRQNRIAGRSVYFTPLGREARAGLETLWREFSGEDSQTLTLVVKGRDLVVPAYINGVGRFDFYDLCGAMLGPADYLALADHLRVLFLDDIPQLGRNNFNEAKRFVTLIDALYEARVRLVCSAAARPEMLYLEGEGSFEFERTASRLREMQAADWAQDRA